MLVLNRHVGESIMINDDIKITILGSVNNQVRVGIEAPEHISVHRQEIYNRICEERASAIENSEM